MLEKLSAKTHHVITGITILSKIGVKLSMK